MVVGFFTSYIMIHLFSWLLGQAIKLFFAGFTAENFIGPLTILAMLALVMIIMVANAHKLFAMTTHLAENVMRWIGGQAHQLGETNDEARMRAIFMGGANSLRSGAGGGGRAPAPGKHDSNAGTTGGSGGKSKANEGDFDSASRN